MQAAVLHYPGVPVCVAYIPNARAIVLVSQDR